MNYLAHLFLSGSNEKILIGNFIGDFVKGKQYQDFPHQIAQGIILHRQIDSYTDQHPVVGISKERLRGELGRFSGIAVDIIYDHLLGANWDQYSKKKLPEFAADVYALLERNKPVLPHKVQAILPRMKRDNWLVNYATYNGLHRSLSGVDYRFGEIETNLPKAVEIVKKERESFESDFFSFFSDLSDFANEWLRERSLD